MLGWADQAERTAALVVPVKTGIQEALLKTVLPRQGECGRYQRVIRYQPVIAEEPAPAEAGGRNPESEHWRPSVFMLDARLIGRFPLMQLAWIPA